MPTKKTSKRRSPIARSFIRNSVSAYMSAIEIHNKPIFRYRYEVVVILIINAWELALKAFIYKYYKKVKLFKRDGTTKTFPECLEFANSTLGKMFNVTYENLDVLYKYRNIYSHHYSEEINLILFSLVSKNVSLYRKFLEKHFGKKLEEEDDLILLPIGFKKPLSPFEYMSNETVISQAPDYLKEFMSIILKSADALTRNGIDESILVDFKVNLTNAKRIRNADLIAGIDNSLDNKNSIRIEGQVREYSLSDSPEAMPMRFTSDPKEAGIKVVFPKVAKGIFEEINNVVDSNDLLAPKKGEFVLGEPVYYRIYAERNHVKKTADTLKLFTETNIYEFYGPFLYWANLLSTKQILELIKRYIDDAKHPKMLNLVKLIGLLGSSNIIWLNEYFTRKYGKWSQPPGYVFTVKQIAQKVYKTNCVVSGLLRVSQEASLDIGWQNKKYTIRRLMSDRNLTNRLLSEGCMQIFNRRNEYKTLVRHLDVIANVPSRPKLAVDLSKIEF